MSNSSKPGKNLSIVSIRCASSSKELSDANKLQETSRIPINIEALRSISRIVGTIRKRIDEAERRANDSERCGAGDSSSPKDVSSDSSKDHHGEKEKR